MWTASYVLYRLYCQYSVILFVCHESIFVQFRWRRLLVVFSRLLPQYFPHFDNDSQCATYKRTPFLLVSDTCYLLCSTCKIHWWLYNWTVNIVSVWSHSSANVVHTSETTERKYSHILRRTAYYRVASVLEKIKSRTFSSSFKQPHDFFSKTISP